MQKQTEPLQVIRDYLTLSSKPLSNVTVGLPRSWSKTYVKAPKLPLPLVLSGEQDPLARLSAYLMRLYGMVNWTAVNRSLTEHPVIRRFQRALPSGGAIYPNELYLLAGPTWGVEPGIYHYNPYAHELTRLRTGHLVAETEAALFRQAAVGSCDLVLFVTSLLDKNSHKYFELSYRIQTLDTGVTLERVKQVSEELDLKATLHLQFHDERIERLLGLSRWEAAHGVCVVSMQEVAKPEVGTPDDDPSALPAFELSGDYEETEFLALLQTVHGATRMEKPKLVRDQTYASLAAVFPTEPDFPLPEPRELAPLSDEAYMEHRFTSFHYLAGGSIDLQQLSDLLAASFTPYGVEDVPYRSLPIDLCLYCHEVDGLPRGLYAYAPAAHALRQVRAADMSEAIRSHLIQPDLDLQKVAVTMFLVGDYKQALTDMGARGYRLLHLFGGMLTERLFHHAITLGLAKYPLLSFFVQEIKALLPLHEEQYPMLLFFVGNERPNALIRLSYPMHL
ncbi:MAG: SagB family peptide dehydrogenase [Tumebacillaceae bacterium]